jgi:beta-glucanase (GH16 family)
MKSLQSEESQFRLSLRKFDPIAFRKMKSLRYSLFLLLSVACSEPEPEDVLPTNLTLTFDIAQDGSRVVSVTATAKDAKYYLVSFGETVGATPDETTGGVPVTHIYAKKGTYTVTVVAHANEELFITETEEIVVPGVPPPAIDIVNVGYTTPATYDGMTLVWSDEFNVEELNSEDYVFETGNGTGGWGNNELEYYREENTSFKDGFLVITAKQEAYRGFNYTSSRIKTQGKKTFKFGRIDIRARLPKGQGIWPAFWFLGTNITTAGWPVCGEIDMMEMIGGNGREATVFGTLHWNSNGHVCTCDKPGFTLPSGTFNDEFHVFTMEWTETSIKWFVDDVQFNVIDTSPAGLNAFRNDYFFIMNLAVGGNWPGAPNNLTVFPQYLIVDYIRVFQED